MSGIKKKYRSGNQLHYNAGCHAGAKVLIKFHENFT